MMLAEKPYLDTIFQTVRVVPIHSIRPSIENGQIYRQVTDESVRTLADDIRLNGIKEPLQVSADDYIISGHRRHAAAVLAGLEAVPVIVRPDINYKEDYNGFLEELARFNYAQREKSTAEQIRETAVIVAGRSGLCEADDEVPRGDPGNITPLDVDRRQKRGGISKGREQFYNAVIAILQRLNEGGFLPCSTRAIHYQLLNNPPLMHASKPGSLYRNNPKSYNTLTDLVSRARMNGAIPWWCVSDETRPVNLYRTHQTVSEFTKDEMEGFLTGYNRDLLQTQPYHVEIIGEKNTVGPVLEPVARQYGIPLTLGRGFVSHPPLHDIVKRYQDSGKQGLYLLFVTDLDPEGACIPEAATGIIRDEMGARDTDAVRVALNPEQVEELGIHPNAEAKVTSTRFDSFVAKYGLYAYELEAVPPQALQEMLRTAIEATLDMVTFREQLARQKLEREDLKLSKQRIMKLIRE